MITITDKAAKMIREILKVEGVPEHGFRVTAGAGGCCGPQYEIMIDERPAKGDAVAEKDGAKIFLDEATAKALSGAELDYVSTKQGEGFVLNNPNAGPGCGCGTDKGAENCGPDKKSGGCGCG